MPIYKAIREQISPILPFPACFWVYNSENQKQRRIAMSTIVSNEVKSESKLTKAFDELRKHGYFAKEDFWCCQTCGWAAIPDEQADKAVFYHNQDTERLQETGELYLCWSGDGQEIKTILEAEGLTVEWDGTDNTRILVKVD
jgi:hypothetical protein